MGAPGRWGERSLTPFRLADLFQYDIFPRAYMYGDSYVTSKAYGKATTRDNRWILFQHHVHRYASPHPRRRTTCHVHPAYPSPRFLPYALLSVDRGVASMCRKNNATKTLAGEVQYCVKATPASARAKEALSALGLPTEPQRFAVVEAYEVNEVQKACSGLSLATPWVQAAARALTEAGVLPDPAAFTKLLGTVAQDASVLGMVGDARGSPLQVVLHDGRKSKEHQGVLRRLAVPISSNYHEWYGKGEHSSVNWGVHPLVRIDRRKVKLQVANNTDQVKKAIARAMKTPMYFVHSFSKSNQ